MMKNYRYLLVTCLLSACVLFGCGAVVTAYAGSLNNPSDGATDKLTVGGVTKVRAVAGGANVVGDLATTGKLTVGSGATGVLSVPAGTLGANSIQFGGSATTGFYSTGAGVINASGNINAGSYNTADFSHTSTGGYYIAGASTLLIKAGSPAITSGFGTSPTITATNTAAFKITVGTGGAASGVLTFPAASNGWAVTCEDKTTTLFLGVPVKTRAFSTSTTSVTIQAIYYTTGAAASWLAGDVIECSAMGY